MKKFIPLCLCAALLVSLAACRDVVEKPFNVYDFIPATNATVTVTVEEQSEGHALLEIEGSTLQKVVEYYELALAFVHSEQIRLNDADENFWDYTGTYGEKHIVKIAARVNGDSIRVLVNYLDEMD